MAGACQGLLEGSHHQSPSRAVRRWNPMYSTQCEWIREWTLLREAATNTSDDKKGWFFFNINILLQRGPCQLTGLAACMSKCHPDLSCCLLRADARSLNQSQASHKRCGVDNVYTIERPAGCLWYERGKIVKKKMYFLWKHQLKLNMVIKPKLDFKVEILVSLNGEDERCIRSFIV